MRIEADLSVLVQELSCLKWDAVGLSNVKTWLGTKGLAADMHLTGEAKEGGKAGTWSELFIHESRKEFGHSLYY